WSELAGARNVNDIHGGLDGTKQAIWFPLAAIVAFAVAAIVGTLTIKISRDNSSSGEVGADDSADQPGVGLEGLIHRSYFANLPSSLRTFRSEVGDIWRNGLIKADRWSLFRLILGRSSN
ncbi:uncharacterized protein METZ01_LOCUS346877, partial [marine metagenome]